MAAQEDKDVIEVLKQVIMQTNELLELDDQYSISDGDNENDNGESLVAETRLHHHHSQKLSCPTRWNSSLMMIESIVDLQ